MNDATTTTTEFEETPWGVKYLFVYRTPLSMILNWQDLQGTTPLEAALRASLKAAREAKLHAIEPSMIRVLAHPEISPAFEGENFHVWAENKDGQWVVTIGWLYFPSPRTIHDKAMRHEYYSGGYHLD